MRTTASPSRTPNPDPWNERPIPAGGPGRDARRCSVWATAQHTTRVQRADRYLSVSGTHPAKMLPAVAATAIAAYTEPGDLVVDPMCGIGTTLVEAMHLGRDALGIEYEPQWAAFAQANLDHARAHGAPGHGRVTVGDARHLSTTLEPVDRGIVALLLTSPPYGSTLHGQVDARPGEGIVKTHDRYSKDPANLAHIGHPRLLEAMLRILTESRAVLRPGGHLAMTVRPYWSAGQLVDLPGQLAALAEPAGLTLVARHVALLAAVRYGQLIPRASFFTLDQVRKARARGVPRLVTAHEDLLVYRRPA